MANLAIDSNRNQAPLKIRINRRGWAVLVGIPVFLATIAAAFTFSMFVSSAQASSVTPAGLETVEVTVISGDTLWDLAHEYAVGYDVHSAMDNIVELNSLDSTAVQAGD